MVNQFSGGPIVVLSFTVLTLPPRSTMRSFRFRSVASLFLASLAMASQAAPDTPPRYAVSGLEKPVKILIDRWGVPHIYANALYDAFYAQGFMASREWLTYGSDAKYATT